MTCQILHTQLPGWSDWTWTNECRCQRPVPYPLGYTPILAVSVGFEPTDAFTSPVFKTGVIDHSTNLPMAVPKGNAPSSSQWQCDIVTFRLRDHNGGSGWIWTTVPLGPDLQSDAINRSATDPFGAPGQIWTDILCTSVAF